ncbi:hypothetical protein GOV04_00335 [Candidatus Woesearchaeota archaeon]|nr:hypothetical protein [Candidatus Woesearchaeota archaeon]
MKKIIFFSITILLVFTACSTPSQEELFESSQTTALEFVKNSPTFVFDGIEETLTVGPVVSLSKCKNCWLFEIRFDSRAAGYGDRSGQILAQVITEHNAKVFVEDDEVTAALLDEQWDMVVQKQRS